MSAFEGVTHFRIALQIEGEAFGFCRAQLEYALERRVVTRVPCYRRVIASTETTRRAASTSVVGAVT